MNNDELLTKIQAVADEGSKKFVRPAKLSVIYTEDKPDGSVDAYCLGDDMPLLIYRIFNVSKDGVVTEVTDIQKAVEATRHYNVDIKPTLKLVPPAVEEGPEYEIEVENKLDNGGVEIKLKSSIGRDVTMIEIYRYFDYVSKIFFVSCIGLSFGGQYLFSVTPDSKHIKLIVGRNDDIKKRIDMITELLQNRLLPSYQTISAAAELLSGKVKAHITLNGQDGAKNEFDSTFCYDDPSLKTRYAFFADPQDNKKGVILICDILDNNKLIPSNAWTDEQKKEVDVFKALMKEKPEEFNKNCCSFFADDLDFRYDAFKAGKLHATAPAAPATAPVAEEKK
ncbi:MAG: hypothetical protein WCR56_06345 [Bacilli bacterium]|jgi:hypothetical protein